MPDATLGQGKQILDLLLREQDPRGFAQSLIENWGDVRRIGRQGGVLPVVGVGSQVNPFASEVSPINYKKAYSVRYQPDPVMLQSGAILSFFPELDQTHVKAIAWRLSFSDRSVDGLYVVPKPSALARIMGIDDPYGAGWGELTRRSLFESLAKQRSFAVFFQSQFGPGVFRLRDSVWGCLKSLEVKQPGDFLVFPGRTGILYEGYSVRNTRWHVERRDEWLLPTYCVGWMLVANKDRLRNEEDLWIACPGDELRLSPEDSEFSHCPYFRCTDSLSLAADAISSHSADIGSAVGLK